MSSLCVPEVNNVHAARPQAKKKSNDLRRIHYRPIRLTDADLISVATIQRAMLRAQSKPKSGVNFAHAVRAAVEFYAAHLERQAAARREANEVFAIR